MYAYDPQSASGSVHSLGSHFETPDTTRHDTDVMSSTFFTGYQQVTEHVTLVN